LVEEFFDEEIERRQHSIAEQRGFTLAEHALALYGNCTKGLPASGAIRKKRRLNYVVMLGF
jgi:hypothetical protein